MLSIPSIESRMWLGAGNIHARQPTILYAASQVPRMRTQIRSRLRLPEIFCQFGVRQAGVDTVYLFFNFRSDQMHQLSDLLAVEIARMLERNQYLPADSTGMGVQTHNPIRQPHRLAHRVCDK